VLVRRDFACPSCDQGDFGADRILGVDGDLTRGACRMACLLGVQRSFKKAETAPLEVAGWELDDHPIRQLGHETAERARSTRERRDTAEAFARAEGDPELHIDAGEVNTKGGGRDVKVAVVARREPGRPITAAEWDDRDLPAPAVRSVAAAVEQAEAFGGRCAAQVRRLGLTDPKRFHVPGDGAQWVRNLAERHFSGGSRCLDFWHGAAYLGAAADAAFGPGRSEAAAELGRGKKRRLEDGYWGVTRWIGELASKMPPAATGPPRRRR